MGLQDQPQAAILVIDDEEIVHESVRRILEEEGYLVGGAFRVDEALAHLKKTPYDLVITDLMIPDKDGLEAVKAIGRDYPGIGVIMFTGYPSVDSAVGALKFGSLDYLPKPFTPDELLEVVKRSLNKINQVRREREMEGVYAEAEKALKSSLDLTEVLDLINQNAVRLLGVKGSSVFLLNRKEKILELRSSFGLSEAYLGKGRLDSGKSIPEVMQTSQPQMIKAASFDRHLQYPEEAKQEGIAAILSLPLTVQDLPVGVLRIYSADSRPFTQEEMAYLQQLADYGARAIENALSFQRVLHDIDDLKKYMP